MKATNKRIIAGIGLIALAGIIIYLRRRHKTNIINELKSQQVAEHGYETAHDILFPKNRPITTEYSVIYGIITSSTKDLNIPFFSKVTLKNYKRVLAGYGFEVYLSKIQNVNIKSKI